MSSERGLTPDEAWPIEKRRADMRRDIARLAAAGELARIWPTKFAPTYGVTKDEVKAEIMKHNELGGMAK